MLDGNFELILSDKSDRVFPTFSFKLLRPSFTADSVTDFPWATTFLIVFSNVFSNKPPPTIFKVSLETSLKVLTLSLISSDVIGVSLFKLEKSWE